MMSKRGEIRWLVWLDDNLECGVQRRFSFVSSDEHLH